MHTNSSVARRVAVVTGMGLVVSPVAALASPAFASGCTASTPTATEVSPNVCEVSFTSAGDYTFSVPSGVAKLSAVIVGGGGGAVPAMGIYAGGGGDVVYVESVDISAALDVTVGAGVDASESQAGDSSVNSDVAAGGYSGTWDSDGTQGLYGGDSGNGNAGSFPDSNGGAGGGAGGDADGYDGGPGLTASEVANEAAMWPAVPGEDAFGAGGDYDMVVATSDIPGEGASTSGGFGNDGAVYLRWSAELPQTGLSASQWWSVASAFMISGAALIALALRGRRRDLST